MEVVFKQIAFNSTFFFFFDSIKIKIVQYLEVNKFLIKEKSIAWVVNKRLHGPSQIIS